MLRALPPCFGGTGLVSCGAGGDGEADESRERASLQIYILGRLGVREIEEHGRRLKLAGGLFPAKEPALAEQHPLRLAEHHAFSGREQVALEDDQTISDPVYPYKLLAYP